MVSGVKLKTELNTGCCNLNYYFLWICGFVDLWILVCADLWICGFWAFPYGSGFALQSFCSFLTKRISTSIPHAKLSYMTLSVFWAFPYGSGFTLQSFCSFLTKRISTSIPNVKLSCITLSVFWAFPAGRAFRCNLFVRSSQKGFPLQSLTRKASLIGYWCFLHEYI